MLRNEFVHNETSSYKRQPYRNGAVPRKGVEYVRLFECPVVRFLVCLEKKKKRRKSTGSREHTGGASVKVEAKEKKRKTENEDRICNY